MEEGGLKRSRDDLPADAEKDKECMSEKTGDKFVAVIVMVDDNYSTPPLFGIRALTDEQAAILRSAQATLRRTPAMCPRERLTREEVLAIAKAHFVARIKMPDPEESDPVHREAALLAAPHVMSADDIDHRLEFPPDYPVRTFVIPYDY